MRAELVRRQQEVIEKHKLSMQEADRASTEQWNQNGSAREYGIASRVAAAGRHGRGRGPRHAVDSGAAGNDA